MRAVAVFVLAAFLSVVAMSSCSSSQRVYFSLYNSASHSITIKVSSGLIWSRSITIEPGRSWDGWVFRSMAGQTVYVKLAE